MLRFLVNKTAICQTPVVSNLRYGARDIARKTRLCVSAELGFGRTHVPIETVTHEFSLESHGPPSRRFWLQRFAYVLFVPLAAPVAVLSQELRYDGFVTPNSVAGMLAATADCQSDGALEGFQAWKKELERGTELSFAFDAQVQYLGTNSDRSPSDAASNVFRFYGIGQQKLDTAGV